MIKIELSAREKNALFALFLCLFFFVFFPFFLARFCPAVVEFMQRAKLLMLAVAPVIAIALRFCCGERFLRAEDLKNIRFLRLSLYGVGMLFVCGISAILWLQLLKMFHIEYDTVVPVEEFIKSCEGAELAAAGFFICLAVPFCEEFIFRRVIFEGLRVRCPLFFSIALTSLFFSALHGILFQLLPLFVLGVYFQTLYMKNNKIGEAFYAHCFNNSLAFLFLMLIRYVDKV